MIVNGEENASTLCTAALEAMLGATLGALVLIVGRRLESSFTWKELVDEAVIPRKVAPLEGEEVLRDTDPSSSL